MLYSHVLIKELFSYTVYNQIGVWQGYVLKKKNKYHHEKKAKQNLTYTKPRNKHVFFFLKKKKLIYFCFCCKFHRVLKITGEKVENDVGGEPKVLLIRLKKAWINLELEILKLLTTLIKSKTRLHHVTGN